MKVIFSKKASDKLLSIYFYIAHQQHAPENAEKLINQIRKQSQILAVTPRMGRVLENDKKRFIVVKNHILVYEIKEEIALIVQIYGPGENWKTKIQ